jgi:hypothetical protein
MLVHSTLVKAQRPTKCSAKFVPNQRCVRAMAKDSLQETKDGAFRRTASTFRNNVSADGEFKPAGAYSPAKSLSKSALCQRSTCSCVCELRLALCTGVRDGDGGHASHSRLFGCFK